MSARRVRVAVPWLQAALADAAASDAYPMLDALRWLGAMGRLQDEPARSWREWLLEPTGADRLLAQVPAGPAIAATHGKANDETGAWCLAQPVHLSTGLDHLRLAPLAAATPSALEQRELSASVAAHFAATGMRIEGFFDGAWLLRCEHAFDCTTQPPDAAVGHDVHDFMPGGRDGARLRSLMNEIQMLLHEHPVNEQRVRARQLPINAWWLWGFGAGEATRSAESSPWTLTSDDPWLSALWALRSGTADDGRTISPGTSGTGHGRSNARNDDSLLAVSQPSSIDGPKSLIAINAGLLASLVAELRAGTIKRLDLRVGTHVLQLDAWARFRFWRRPLDLARWLA